jgi:hypothetical protein
MMDFRQSNIVSNTTRSILTINLNVLNVIDNVGAKLVL